MSTYFYWLATVGQAPTYILVGIFLLLAAGIQAYRMRGLFKNGARFEITLTPQYIRLQAIDGQALRLDWNTHPKLGPFDAQRLCIYNDATGTSFLQRNLLPTRATDLHNIIDYYSHHPENRWELAAPEGLNRVVDMCTHTKK
ncbi:hypothetical protein [Schaalia vaccimaxillae]|uniref:hypothetical protein n=1 Tax=Schaalia vaccimaxillae TaxID=183916 RepID=UPI00103E4D92|nr:hypothetical protein [Schaalia vaccimaxillae]